MQKKFDEWNKVKKEIHSACKNNSFFFHEREIWWCSLGINIGVEMDGKNNYFERPIVILKKFNSEMIWVLPLTTKHKNDSHFIPIHFNKGFSFVCLSQIRTISSKRLFRKIGMISKQEFEQVVQKIYEYIKIGPRISTKPSEA